MSTERDCADNVKMGESEEVCEEIISAIFQSPVKVLRVVPQNAIASLQGRGVRLESRI